MVWKMQSSLLGLTLFVVFSAAEDTRRCYVCGPGSEEPFVTDGGSDVDGETIQSCDELERTTSARTLQKFVRECPKSRYRGCTTQIDGNIVVRTCSLIQINDCRIANHIHYCFCAGDLCNGRKAVAIKTALAHEDLVNEIPKLKTRQRFTDISDDEDDYLSEGSGDIWRPTTRKPPTKRGGTYTITLKPVYTETLRLESSTQVATSGGAAQTFTIFLLIPIVIWLTL